MLLPTQDLSVNQLNEATNKKVYKNGYIVLATKRGNAVIRAHPSHRLPTVMCLHVVSDVQLLT